MKIRIKPTSSNATDDSLSTANPSDLIFVPFIYQRFFLGPDLITNFRLAFDTGEQRGAGRMRCNFWRVPTTTTTAYRLVRKIAFCDIRD